MDHPFDALEDALRAYRAIEPDHVRPQTLEPGRDVLRCRAERRPTVGPDRHLRHHGHRGVDVARGVYRLPDLLEVPERLDDEQVGTAFLQRSHLLGEGGAGLFEAGRPVGFEPDA